MSEDLKNAFKRGVYFHAVGGALTHNAGCLIEGVIALGIPVKVCGPRITSRPVSMPLAGIDMTAYVAPLQSGMAAYIVDVTHTNAFAPLSSIGDGMVAYLNQGDVATFSKIPDDQLLFAAHESTFLNKGGARVPVAFGLSKGLIAATDNRPAFAAREAKALRNFRATLSQSVRALLDLSFVPALARHLPVDDAILGPAAYLKAMLNSAVCLAYGGEFYAPIAGNPWFQQNEPKLAEIHALARIAAPAAILR